MRNVFLLTVTAAGLLAAAAGPALAGPNLLLNGSFEAYANGVFTGWRNSGTLGVTPSAYAGPHATDGVTPGPYGDVVGPDLLRFSPDAAGVQGAWFVADDAAQSLSQQVTLTAGTVYEAGFDLLATPAGALNEGLFTLTGRVGDLVVGAASAANTTPGVWQHYALTFTASTQSMFSLDFTSGAPPAKDVIIELAYLHAVAVPEPGSLLAFGAGLAGLGAGLGTSRRPRRG